MRHDPAVERSLLAAGGVPVGYEEEGIVWFFPRITTFPVLLSVLGYGASCFAIHELFERLRDFDQLFARLPRYNDTTKSVTLLRAVVRIAADTSRIESLLCEHWDAELLTSTVMSCVTVEWFAPDDVILDLDPEIQS